MDPIERWTPKTTVRAIVGGKLLDVLTHPQLVVYMKILGESAAQKKQQLPILNARLWREARTCVRTLKELERYGLIKIHYDRNTRLGREIEVL